MPQAGHAETDYAETFQKEILPILEDHCYDCHGDGENKGKVSFDKFGSTGELMNQPELWAHALKNIRSGMMPPAKKKRIPAEDFAKLEDWIKRGALKLDPQHPDPGRVTLRRLNRVEYHNTISDLMGIDFHADEEFPADDTGYGFDNIGDVLSTSSMLLEKYMAASETIVARAIPLETRVYREREIKAHFFNGLGGKEGAYDELSVSLYDPADITAMVEVPKTGTYRVVLNASVRSSYAYDAGIGDAEWFVDGKSALHKQLKWQDGTKTESSTEVTWEAGTKHPLRFAMKPLVGIEKRPAEVPNDGGAPDVRLSFQGATLIGPISQDSTTRPKNYSRFFPREEVPEDEAGRRQYAEEILRSFTTRAFRRPMDDATVQRLTGLAMESAAMSGGTFERGIARAITAVLASPRFLFRMEDTLPEADPQAHPLLDEYALASRLSYFLWSTMPDDTLYQLADRGELRTNLSSQVERMLKDDRSDELVENFAGQWLQSRDVQSVSIDARIVLARDAGQEKDMRQRFEKFQKLNRDIDEAEKAHDNAKVDALKAERAEMRAKFGNGGKKIEFSGSLRTAMRRETEMLFKHLIRTDGSVLQLIENDSTFLNEELANHYGVPDVHGGEMRLVKLPPDSPRGGVLTMGTVLAVTSNPTRTSPVKRGLFILDNILGTPPPPPPPNIPSLEASEKTHDGDDRSLREALALHREKPLCSSCHDRMDPLGLAMENFNAMGLWRDKERGQPIEGTGGKLITGETFADVKELKHVLVTARRTDYYRCLTEKMLTYALGRGPEPCDITTVDALVEDLEKSEGKFSKLITGIIDSTPFQRRHLNTP
jgi:hypothetical protein